MGKTRKKSTEHPGLKIQRLRKKLGLNRKELANQTGLNDETVARIEQGKEIPPVGAILQISRVLGMDASGLLNEHSMLQSRTMTFSLGRAYFGGLRVY